MVSDPPVHAQGLADPGEPTATAAAAPLPATTPDVDGHDDAGHAVPGDGGEGHAALPLGALATGSRQPATALPIGSATTFRVCDIVRLLNGTGIGRVICERQLHRHRIRSHHVFAVPPLNKYSRIHLLRYIAWLFNQRRDQEAGPSTGKITYDGLAGLLVRQSYRCALTGRPLEPGDTSLDHTLPVSRGGQHVLENAQFLQTSVNRAKGTLTNDEFIALCRAVAAWADRPQPEHAHA